MLDRESLAQIERTVTAAEAVQLRNERAGELREEVQRESRETRALFRLSYQ